MLLLHETPPYGMAPAPIPEQQRLCFLSPAFFLLQVLRLLQRLQRFQPADVPAEQVEHERQVQLEIAMKENAEAAKPKPAEIVEKIINGRMAKYTGEVSLTTQNFVKDDSITVGDLLKKNNAVVKSFVRMVVGEGIEKQVVDFATEVAQQVAAAQK